jgi:hypothetical protein
LAHSLEQLRREGKVRYVGLAGAAGNCAAVAARFPAVAQIMQIDAAAGAQEFEVLRRAGLPCHFSFGHFRDKRAPVSSLLAGALRDNPLGVLLYSSRHPARVAEMAERLTDIDSQ